MTRNSDGPCLSAIFVDYDNIYLSLKRKDEEAARRFAKDAVTWLKAIEQGKLITTTNGNGEKRERRIVMSRCYGNPVPRRNSRDNSTDMSSFPFVRHHFLRAGFEIVDCPPLTAQLKNSSDIRMVMDMRDYLTHETRFDEFIILSGDADFTPVLQRLRAHNRSTAIFANDQTATPYTEICDGEIREVDFIKLLLEGTISAAESARPADIAKPVPLVNDAEMAAMAADIIAVVVATVDVADKPLSMESVADRVQRALGSERTSGANWAGAGTFKAFLDQHLPERLQLTTEPPYMIFSPERLAPVEEPRQEDSSVVPLQPAAARAVSPVAARRQAAEPVVPAQLPPRPRSQNLAQSSAQHLQQSVAKIHEACQAPPLAPPEYKMLFELLSAELREFTFNGDNTVGNVLKRARREGFDPRRDDIRFVIDVVREADPYFEQGVSPAVFAGRFRNFVIARCRSQGMQLSSDEIDLIDAWFTGGIPGAVPRSAEQANIPQMNGGTAALRNDDRWQSEEDHGRFEQAPKSGRQRARV
jgi:uncharacterized LabA/DUF88 family protein